MLLIALSATAGVIVGAVGIIMVSLMVAAGRADDMDEKRGIRRS